MLNGRKTRVLIVDDSAIVRKILSDALAAEPDLEVVGTAPDPYIARDKILALAPDVLTLDIEMPRMDGLTFLKKLMHFHPMPVVVISSLAQPSCRIAVEALENGAVEVMAKPGGPYSVGELRKSLAEKIRTAAYSRVRPLATLAAARPRYASPMGQPSPSTGAILAIGASTGGTEAITAVLRELPANSPPIVIVQHIPPEFSKAFAGRLNDLCAMEVREAADGDALHSGLALVAPGDLHMLLKKSGEHYSVAVKTGPRVCYQRPSADVLFSSVAESAGSAATGVILTGMGSDGAQGMLKMRQAGAYTIAQNEATCVVFGMPREAIALNAVDQILPLHAIAVALLNPKPACKTATAS
jgi:two-component system chemotaxis response regulator CheB